LQIGSAKALFSLPKNKKKDSLYHQILRHMDEVLNIDKK